MLTRFQPLAGFLLALSATALGDGPTITIAPSLLPKDRGVNGDGIAVVCSMDPLPGGDARNGDGFRVVFDGELEAEKIQVRNSTGAEWTLYP